jgi:SAM-dependent methyltransferase
VTNKDVLSTREFYDALAPIYDRELVTRGPYAEAINQVILDWSRTHKPRTILDLGCGNGWRLKRLVEESGAKGVGVDLSPGMVEEAKRKGLDAYVRDMGDPSFDTTELPVAKFDLVVCTWCIGHLLDPRQRLNALRTVRSVLNPNGALIIDVNNILNASAYGWTSAARNAVRSLLNSPGAGDFVTRRSAPAGELATGVHLFARREFVNLLGAAGLQAVDVRYISYTTGKSASTFSGQICVIAHPNGE